MQFHELSTRKKLCRFGGFFWGILSYFLLNVEAQLIIFDIYNFDSIQSEFSYNYFNSKLKLQFTANKIVDENGRIVRRVCVCVLCV